ncbi:MAG: SDR family oxidoreductase [Caulobacteraceae bacterium]|nr:SDR family oxidoreductase [Caulobacteraceae bacterium]
MTTASSVLIIGGASDIGRATALIYAGHGWKVTLAGRNLAECGRIADDIAVRSGQRPDVVELDVLRTDRFTAFVEAFPEAPDTIVCAAGLLGDQARDQCDPNRAAVTLRSNFEGPALLLGAFASAMAARGHGVIVGISSVAGERGRASNYVYGAAKAGFSAFLSGLRHSLVRQGVCVITVKPGFVRTKMTAQMTLPRGLTAEPAEVARAIFKADQAKRPGSLYVRPVWRPIMTIIRMLPEPVFLRMRL